MKSVLIKSILASVVVMMGVGLVSAQTSFPVFNPPPCDFSDQFYADNGVDSLRSPDVVGELNTEPDGRFGDFRKTGPPATGTQVNWVNDSNCPINDPTRRNVRILATTGAFKDSTGLGSEFFSIIAFVHSATAAPPGANPNTTGFFEHDQNSNLPYSRTVGAIGPNGGLAGQQTNAGNTISLACVAPTASGACTQGADQVGNTPIGINPRGISQLEIVNNFEAYGAVKQRLTSGAFAGTIAPTPCGSLFDLDHAGINKADCFSVSDTKDVNNNTISDVATPNLRQDWRVASNRNAIDGSDNNCITNNDQHCKHKGTFSDSPFGYFCDDLLGMWIVTYFWYTENAVGGTTATGGTITPTANCTHVLSCISQVNGNSLDGTPIIRSGDQLHFIEGVSGTLASVFTGQGVQGACLQNTDLPPATAPCGHEGNIDPAGGDHGAVWLVCPVIPDPRDGGIASDAFLDAVRTSSGAFLDTGQGQSDPKFGSLSQNFTCLQQTGKFCEPGQ